MVANFLRPTARGLFLLALLVFFASAKAQNVYTLTQAIADAIALSGDVVAASSQQLQAEESLTQARSHNLPQVTGNGNYGAGEDEAGGRTVINQDGERYSASLQVDQNLWSFGRIDARIKSARAAIGAAGFQRLAAESDVAEQTALAYTSLVFRKDLTGLRKDYVGNVSVQLQAVERHVQRGTAKRTDAARIRTQYFQARNDFQLEQAQLRSAIGVLQRLTGKNLANESLEASAAGLQDLLNYVPLDLDEAVAQAIQSSPLVLQALANLEQAHADAELSESELFPDIGLRGVVSRSTVGDIDSAETSVAVTGTLNLYDGGLRFSQARQSREAVFTAENLVNARKDETSVNMELIWAQIAGHRNGREDIVNAVSEAKGAVNDTQREVNAGSLPVIALTQAQKDLLDVEIALAEIELQYLQSVVSLMRLIGLLTSLEEIG